MESTSSEFMTLIEECRELYAKKLQDYGSAWRILRVPSVTDQILIKANRIRKIQESGCQKVAEDVRSEFIAIVNYAIIALIQNSLPKKPPFELEPTKALNLYDSYAKEAFDLMLLKNHDYGEAWQEMRISSLTDIILQKIYRTKQIENNSGHTIVSEGVEANYYDMINYAVFALIKLSQTS